MRPHNRQVEEMRQVEMQVAYNKYAEGSCLITVGDTVVLCTASIEDRVPFFLKNTGKGWITTEYSMLPRATGTRTQREISKGKPDGRTQEIQRLIGRALRSAIDLSKLGERQIIVDCDVLQADGGTRTASITGGYVALCEAIKYMMRTKALKSSPIISQVAAISCGIVGGKSVLDLEYAEDSIADVDANFVLNSTQQIIEIQGTAEHRAFSEEQLTQMLHLAKIGISSLLEKQREVLKISK